MDNNILWGTIPTKRVKKEEKYNFPVLTLSAIEGKGTGRKFSFNKAAQTELGIQGEDFVIFGFTDSQIFLSKTIEHPNSIKLTKTCTFSDKRTFEYICKLFGLDTSIENELSLIEVEGKDFYEVTNSIKNIDYKHIIKMTSEEAPELSLDNRELGEIIVEEEQEFMPITDELLTESATDEIPTTPIIEEEIQYSGEGDGSIATVESIESLDDSTLTDEEVW